MKIDKLLLILLLLPLTTLAQTGPRGEAWYNANDRGNRFEGYYSDQVGVGTIELLSLVGYAPRYEFNQDQELHVHFYLPEGNSYSLKAEELKKEEYYWCEAQNTQASNGWNVFGPWPVDAQLRRGPVGYRNLGILVSVGHKGSNRYAPSFVSLTNTRQESGYYVAKIGIGRDINNGVFRVYRGEQAVESRLVFEKNLSGGSGGTHISLVTKVSDLPSSGWYTMEIELQEPNGQKMLETFRFYHQN